VIIYNLTGRRIDLRHANRDDGDPAKRTDRLCNMDLRLGITKWFQGARFTDCRGRRPLTDRQIEYAVAM
jgi:hypothetical protein